MSATSRTNLILGTLRIEPWAAGWEARILLLCYATPLTMNLCCCHKQKHPFVADVDEAQLLFCSHIFPKFFDATKPSFQSFFFTSFHSEMWEKERYDEKEEVEGKKDVRGQLIEFSTDLKVPNNSSNSIWSIVKGSLMSFWLNEATNRMVYSTSTKCKLTDKFRMQNLIIFWA